MWISLTLGRSKSSPLNHANILKMSQIPLNFKSRLIINFKPEAKPQYAKFFLNYRHFKYLTLIVLNFLWVWFISLSLHWLLNLLRVRKSLTKRSRFTFSGWRGFLGWKLKSTRLLLIDRKSKTGTWDLRLTSTQDVCTQPELDMLDF